MYTSIYIRIYIDPYIHEQHWSIVFCESLQKLTDTKITNQWVYQSHTPLELGIICGYLWQLGIQPYAMSFSHLPAFSQDMNHLDMKHSVELLLTHPFGHTCIYADSTTTNPPGKWNIIIYRISRISTDNKI